MTRKVTLTVSVTLLIILTAGRPLGSDFGTLDDVVRGAERLPQTQTPAQNYPRPQHENFWDQLSPLVQHNAHTDVPQTPDPHQFYNADVAHAFLPSQHHISAPSTPAFHQEIGATHAFSPDGHQSPSSPQTSTPAGVEGFFPEVFRTLKAHSSSAHMREPPPLPEPQELTFTEQLRRASLPLHEHAEQQQTRLWNPVPPSYFPRAPQFQYSPAELATVGLPNHPWHFNAPAAPTHELFPSMPLHTTQQVNDELVGGYGSAFQLNGHDTAAPSGVQVSHRVDEETSMATAARSPDMQHGAVDADTIPHSDWMTEDDPPMRSPAELDGVIDDRLGQDIHVPDEVTVEFDHTVDRFARAWLGGDRFPPLHLTEESIVHLREISDSVWLRGVRRLQRVVQNNRDFLITYHRDAPFNIGWGHRTIAVWEQLTDKRERLAARGLYPIRHRQNLMFSPGSMVEYKRDKVRVYIPSIEPMRLDYRPREFVAVRGSNLRRTDKVLTVPQRFRYEVDETVDRMIKDFDAKSLLKSWDSSTRRSVLPPIIVSRFAEKSRKVWARVNRLLRITYNDRVYWLTLHYKSTILPPTGGGAGFIIWELDRDGITMIGRGIYPKRVSAWPALNYLGDSSVEFQDPVRPS